MSRRLLGTTLTAVLLLSTGCGGDESVDPAPSDGAEPSEATTSEATDEPTEPAALQWTPTGKDAEQRTIVGAAWTVTWANETDVTFEPNGGGDPVVIADDFGYLADDVFLDGDNAVIAYAAGGEAVQGRAARVDLPSGEVTEVVTPPVSNYGNFARSGDSLWFPALGEDDAQCLGTLAITDMNGEQGWCAPAGSFLGRLNANEHGVGLSLLAISGRGRQCRTPMLLDDSGTPQPALPDEKICTSWDIAPTGTGFVWSQVVKRNRQERSKFFASTNGEITELGIGSTSTLTSCGGDLFYASDPEGPDEPARLMRFDGAELTVAFESESTGNAFLAKPECADGILTVSALGEAGDEQVFAPVD